MRKLPLFATLAANCISALVLLCVLAGCQSLPIAGPLASEVRDEVALRQRVPFRLVNLAPDMVPILEEGSGEAPETFINDLGPAEPRIGPGDTLVVTVVEPGEGGLFSGPPVVGGTGTGTPGARVVTLPEAHVDPEGNVVVPFAGAINVAGLTDTEAAARIRGALSGQAVQPQVMVYTAREESSTLTVSGAVKNPGVLPMRIGETLLEAVARAGGAVEPAENMVVQVTRFGMAHRVRMLTLLTVPGTNIHVRSGDYVHLLVEPRNYEVMGAVDKVDVRTLGPTKLRLASALAASGGLTDIRAEAGSVMLFRFESPAIMDRIAAVQARLARERGENAPIPELPRHGPADAPVPVIFAIDLRSASGLFISQELSVHERDLIYVPDTSYTQLQKFLDLIRLTASPVGTSATTVHSF